MYRITISLSRPPAGPDGWGWNRLAVAVMDPLDRCALLPKTRQAALDTLRGMATFGNPTTYWPCTFSTGCASCPRVLREREPWNAAWHLREDQQGRVWLLGDVERGFAGFGYAYKSWRALLAAVEVPQLQRQIDTTGPYWIAAVPSR